MPMDRFLIGPTGGLETDLKPFLIPEEAAARLDNAYVFRGRIRKRFGSRYMGAGPLNSRLVVDIGTVTSNTLPDNPVTGGTQLEIGQIFSVGSDIFTITQLGLNVPTLSTNIAASVTINSTTNPNTVTFTGEPGGSEVYWYPSLPVMGLITYENGTTEDEPVIGFDTEFAYQFISGSWQRLELETNPGDSVWTGDDTDFFWGYTWTGTSAANKVLFVTNFNQLEPNYMRYLFNDTWTTFRPQIDATPNYLNCARILIPFKNRLLAFNTWEGTSISTALNYQNRVRWSWIGDPTNVTDGWRQDIPGRGSALDATTTEAIITVEFVKDRLIVFFESSTWELVFVGNQAYPFIWQQINTELGAESTFSIVPFDKIALAVGNVGIMACNGTNVERIDDKIPDIVFEVHQTDSGIERVNGIRDYFVEMVYWTFPSPDRNSTQPFCNKVLVYNYKTGSWAFNDDSFTVFGYFHPQTGITWDSTDVTWDSDVSWDSGASQALFRQVIAGNQEGFVLIVDADQPTNEYAIQITNVILGNSPTPNSVTIVAVNHNFTVKDYIKIQNLNGLTLVPPYPIPPATGFLPIYQVNSVIDANTFTIIAPDIQASLLASQTYIGGGLIARASQINILTKQMNFYSKQGRNAYVSKVDFLVDNTGDANMPDLGGAVTVDFYTSTATQSLVTAGESTGSLVGNNVLETFPYRLYPYENEQEQLWHPVYFQADGEYIQLQIYISDSQMLNPTIVDSEFQFHQMIVYATPTSRLQ